MNESLNTLDSTVTKEADFTRSCNSSKDKCGGTQPTPSVSRDRSVPSQGKGKSFSRAPPSADSEQEPDSPWCLGRKLPCLI